MMFPTLRTREQQTKVRCLGALFLALVSTAAAQQVAKEKTTDTKPEEETLVMSPFEVSTSTNEGYLATSSLAGTRLKTELKDVSSAISVITPQFMQDTGATNVNQLLVYTTNTEVGGIGGNYVGDPRTAILTPHLSTRVRGLDSADLTRDYFLTDVPLDSYNVTSVDIQRGPNSILFGQGSPAGIINYSMKTPNMVANKYTTEFRYGSNGKHRETFDADTVILKRTLGVRIDGVNDKNAWRQDGTYDHSQRGYASVRWTPKLADSVYTQFQFNGERGYSSSNRPSVTPPIDYISNWYNPNVNKYANPNWQTFNWNNLPTQSPYLADWQAGPGGNWWDTLGVTFGNPGDSSIGAAFRQRGGSDNTTVIPNVLDAGGWISPGNPVSGLTNRPNGSATHWLNQRSHYTGHALDLINNYEKTTGKAWNASLWNWTELQVTDRSIFDYVNQSLTGPNNTQWDDFNTVNLSFVQTYLNGDAGVEVSYDKQNYNRGNRDLISSDRLTIDINQQLRDRKTANPNFGRAAVVGSNGGYTKLQDREGLRATGYYKYDFRKHFSEKSIIARILGEQVITGLFSSQDAHSLEYSYSLYKLDKSYTPYNTDYGLIGVHYLNSAADLKAASSLQNAHISGVSAVQTPGASISTALVPNPLPGTAGQWVNTTALNVLSWENGMNPMYTRNSSKENKNQINSKALIWQGKLFDGNVVGLFGLRKDDYTSTTKGAPFAGSDSSAGSTDNPYDPRWTWDANNPVKLAASKTARSYGLMLHTPEFIRNRLPGGTEISLGYNESSNFRPGDLGTDVYGSQYAAPTGTTKDYSLIVSTLHDRVNIRITKYKTLQTNAVVPGLPTWSIRSRLTRAMNGMMAEVWGGPPNYSGRTNATPEWMVNKWFFGDSYDKTLANTPLPTGWNVTNHPELLSQPLRVRTAASTTKDGDKDTNGNPISAPAISTEELAYRYAWFNARSDAEWARPFGMQLFNSLQLKKDTGYWGGWWPDGSVDTMKGVGDIQSKGMEYEVTVNATANWRITANASCTEAAYISPWTAIGKYIDDFSKVALDGFDGTNNFANYWNKKGFGQIAAWGADDAQMMGYDWYNDVVKSYLVKKSGSGKSVGELRKWHWNLISSYDFTHGALKGFGIGGAIRWQDKITMGYYPKYMPDLGTWIDDLDNPITAPSEINYDAWMSYKHKLNKHVTWAVQLNLRDLFASAKLIPYRANPDGSMAQYRIPSPTSWELSTRFEF
jgi:outer membrane receptor protein involved in Fe transport